MPKSRYAIMTRYMPKVGGTRPRHDVPDLHHPGQSRLRRRSRHGQEDARRPRAPADRHRALRQFALHRRQAERLPLLPLRDLARHRSPTAPACCPSPSRTASASSAMSTGRSTCRCISSSAATSYHDVAGASFRDLLAGKLEAAARRARDAVGLEQPSLDALPRGAAEALSRDARRRRRSEPAHLRAAGLLGRPPLRPGLARRRLGARQGLDGGGAPGAPRRGAARPRSRRPSATAPSLDIARDALVLSADGLRRRRRLNGDAADESIYLAELERTAETGRTPAEILLDEYETVWHRDIDEVFRRHAY